MCQTNHNVNSSPILLVWQDRFFLIVFKSKFRHFLVPAYGPRSWFGSRVCLVAVLLFTGLTPELPVLMLNHPFSKPEHLSVLLWRTDTEVKCQWQNYNVILLLKALYHQATAWDCYKHIQRSQHRLWHCSPLSAAAEGNVLLRTRLDYACFKQDLLEI